MLYHATILPLDYEGAREWDYSVLLLIPIVADKNLVQPSGKTLNRVRDGCFTVIIWLKYKKHQGRQKKVVSVLNCNITCLAKKCMHAYLAKNDI